MNVTMLLDMAADGFGDRVVTGGRRDGVTASRLWELSIGGARLIKQAGADAVVYLAVNGPAFSAALFAAARADVPLVPVNYRLGKEQLAQLLGRHPHALAIAEPEYKEVLQKGGPPARTPSEWLALAGDEQVDEPEPAEFESPAVIIYTSGTTSAPKGAVLRHENLVSYVLATVEFAGADAEQAALMSVPPYHIAAVSNVLTNLFAGRRVISLESFTPEGWLELVREERVSNAMVVPTMLARIMHGTGLNRSVPSLRSLAYGGSKMPPRVIEAALREWPHVEFVNAYGLTETSSTIAVLGPKEHREAIASEVPAVRARLGSVGRPIPGVDIEIRDDEALVGTGDSGQIWVSGEQVSGEYLDGKAMVDSRGFFDTRDLGHLDSEGYLFIEGRVDDTIIRGAENIAPAEIEDVLLRHPDVIDTVVVGVPDEEWGQRIEAVVVARTGAELDVVELREHVRGALRGSKTPDRIVCWPELPRTATGKVVRREVVAGLAAD